MKKILLVTSLLLALAACNHKTADKVFGPEYCTVKGTVKGVKDGTRLVLLDSWNHFEEISTTVIRDGAFEFHPRTTEPTHVYLFTKDERQLKDFFLEPGTILVEIDANDEEDDATGATGTPQNDLRRKRKHLLEIGDEAAADALMNEVLDADVTGPLALYYAQNVCKSSTRSLDVLDRLAPRLAKRPFVAELREELTRRVKTEPREEGSDYIPLFIDMEYPNVEGQPVSLSSVVNNPDNRYVLLDFWATWCGPCVRSVPTLKELYTKYHSKGLEIYSVSEDTGVKNWKSFLVKNGMTWINVRDDHPGRQDSKAWYNYALHGIPTVVLIDCKTKEIIGRGHPDDLETMLAEINL